MSFSGIVFLVGWKTSPNAIPPPFEIMKTLFASLLAFALTTPLSMAQNQYTLDVDVPTSYFDFSGDTSLGSINGRPGNFNMGGTMDMWLDPASGTFSQAQFNGGIMETVPNVLYAIIPNVFSWLPPLADIEVHDAKFKLTSSLFGVGANGVFTTDVVLHPLSGFIRIIPLVGSTTDTPLTAGGSSDPTPMSGTVSVINGYTTMNSPIDITYSFDDGAGTWADFDLAGTLLADAPVQDNGYILDVNTLTAGGTGAFVVSQGIPQGRAWLAYSLQLGSTHIPQLGVDLGLNNPTQAGSSKRLDANGDGNWIIPIPPNTTGITVYIQSCQMGQVSNVVTTTIQ